MSAAWTERAMLKPGLLEWLAWRRYLSATRASSSGTYPVIEERAWLRLQQDLARFGSPLSAERSSVAEPALPRAPGQTGAASSS